MAAWKPIPAYSLENPGKPGKTRENPGKPEKSSASKSSVRNNRRCKNTALCGAGQARTTIGSVLCTLRSTILGNSRLSLCKTPETASFGLSGAPVRISSADLLSFPAARRPARTPSPSLCGLPSCHKGVTVCFSVDSCVSCGETRAQFPSRPLLSHTGNLRRANCSIATKKADAPPGRPRLFSSDPASRSAFRQYGRIAVPSSFTPSRSFGSRPSA